jgi:hypothetical protein
MLKNTLVNGALMAFGVFFALCAFDIAVYLSPKEILPKALLNLVQQMEMNSGSNYLNHPELGHTIKPGTDFVFTGEEFTFKLQTRLNYPDAGFRGGTLGGPVWGAAFGDSFTFGAGVDQTETWVGQLAKLTNREIINFGVPAYGPHQYTRIFQKYGAPLRPKIIFYTLYTNDLEDAQRFENRGKSDQSSNRNLSIKRFLKNYSASNNLFRNLIHSFATKRRDNTWGGIGLKLLDRKLRNPYGIPDGEFESTWAAVAKQIDAAVEESKRINATFVLLYFPSKEEVYWQLAKEQVKPIKDFEERIERLSKTTQNFCRVRQLLCLDLSSALRDRGINGEKLYFPIDIHWNQRGHLAVAQEIFKFLRDKNLIN